jgi:hypothetical protein
MVITALILPDGQISENLSSPICKNNSVSLGGKSLAYLMPSRALSEGRWPSSRTLGAGCGGRGSVVARGVMQGGLLVREHLASTQDERR